MYSIMLLHPLACEQSPKACLKRSASVDDRRPTNRHSTQRMQTCDHSTCELLGRRHMIEYGACRGAGQLLGPSNPRVESLVESKRRRRRPPRPSHPGWIWLWSPNGEHDSFSNHCKERTIGSHCPLPLVGLGQPSGRSQAVSTDQAEGVRDDAGWRRRAQGSRDGARRRWSLLVPMCSQGRGSIRAASGTTLGPPGTRNLKENRRFYGF